MRGNSRRRTPPPGGLGDLFSFGRPCWGRGVVPHGRAGVNLGAARRCRNEIVAWREQRTVCPSSPVAWYRRAPSGLHPRAVPVRRPSHYMLLCSVLVLATFSASGHLHIGAPNLDDPAAQRRGPAVVKLEPARREPTALRVSGSPVDT